MGNIKAGVVVVTEFCKANNGMFQGYIDYIDRDEAIRNVHVDDYNIYQDYMGNPYKTTGLFTQDKSCLTEAEKRELKNDFSMAQENQSLMWQTVISFDNEWLAKQGLWNGYLSKQNEKKLQTIIRKSVNEMLEKEKLQNAVWSAAFHLNTDNLHVHIAIVEPVPMREKKAYPVYKEYKKNGKTEEIQVGNKMEYKGKFKLSSIETCKRVVVNEITNQREQNLAINKVIRESIVQKKREMHLRQDEELKEAFFSLYEKMPDCKRSLWNYNSSKMAHLRGDIDALSFSYIEKYHAKDFKELKDRLIKQDEMYREAYGKSESSYLNNKIDDLYNRLGNAILKEIKEYDKNIRSASVEDEKEIKSYPEYEEEFSSNEKEYSSEDDLIEYAKRNIEYKNTIDSADSNRENDYDMLGKEESEKKEYIEWSKEFKAAKKNIYGKEKDYDKAQELLLMENEKGNVLATYELGNIYQYGLGVEINIETAQNYYNKALHGFHAIYESEKYVEQLLEGVKSKESKSQNEENFIKTYSSYRIGKHYERGLGTEQDYEKAYSWFLESAEEGNKFARYAMGNLYYEGKGVEQNYQKAFKCYLDAENKIPYARYKVALMLEEGIGTEANLKKSYEEYKVALKEFLKVVEKNQDADLYYRIGSMYLHGKGTEIDKKKARYYIGLAADGKNPYAQCTLAFMMLENNENIDEVKKLLENAALEGKLSSAQYAMGKLTEDDINVSLKWYKMASDNGNKYASYRLGKLFQDREEIKNVEYAKKYFIKAMEQGNKEVYYNLGKIYLDEGNIKESEEYLLKASETGNVYADYRLGKMYLEKKEVKNIEKGLKHLIRAADQDNEAACFYLGHVYLQKETRNVALAVKYFEKASLQGNSNAEYMLGEVYLREYKNQKMAKKYFQMAAEKGNEYAQNRINGMKRWEYNRAKRMKSYSSQKAINGLRKALDNSYESYKSQLEYERVMEEQRREKSSQREISK